MPQDAYSRQSTFSNGDVIDASLFNAEYDQLALTFNASTGHTHSGAAGEGAYVPLIADLTGVTKIEIDTTTDTNDHAIKFTLDGVVVAQMNEASVWTGFDSVNMTHDSQVLDTFLTALDARTVDAAADAAAAAASAAAAAQDADDAAASEAAAVAAAAVVGVPVYIADAGTHTILNTDVAADIVFEGDGTLVLPTTLVKGRRFSARLSFKAVSTKLVNIATPNFKIFAPGRNIEIGDTLTLSPGDTVNLEVISTSELEVIV